MTEFNQDELRIISDALFYILALSEKGKKEVTVLRGKILESIEKYDCPETRDINCIKSCPTCGKHHE